MIHECIFVDTENPLIHTQTVERKWMRAKSKIRQKLGTSETFIMHTTSMSLYLEININIIYYIAS